MNTEPGEESEVGGEATQNSSTGKDQPSAKCSEQSVVPQRLPQPAVGRLSLYYRELRRLLDEGEASLNSQA